MTPEPFPVMSSAREHILDRVRRALQTSAPHPLAPTDAAIFAPVTDLEARFRTELAALNGELLDGADALKTFLAGFRSVATDASPLVGGVVGEGNSDVRQAELGVTSCDCLVALSGSVVLTARAAGGRALSVLPPVHLVIATRDQLVPDLDTALVLVRERYEDRWPSNLTVITGPSRTADIEKILVLGAHGPKRLVVHLMG
ncbi:lactate utilization protein [bacterium]|nr:lactate utilization protein [bacterium]